MCCLPIPCRAAKEVDLGRSAAVQSLFVTVGGGRLLRRLWAVLNMPSRLAQRASSSAVATVMCFGLRPDGPHAMPAFLLECAAAYAYPALPMPPIFAGGGAAAPAVPCQHFIPAFDMAPAADIRHCMHSIWCRRRSGCTSCATPTSSLCTACAWRAPLASCSWCAADSLDPQLARRGLPTAGWLAGCAPSPPATAACRPQR